MYGSCIVSFPCSAAQKCIDLPSGSQSRRLKLDGSPSDGSENDLSHGNEQVPDNVDFQRKPFRWSEWSPKVAQLNAPRENGSTLIEPPLSLAGEMAAINQHTISTASYDLQGRTLSQLAAEARSQLLAEALRNTHSYRDVSVPAQPTAVFLAGHQPEMFHPGVWLKNFVLARLARQHQAVAVNLQIDSDAMKTASIRVLTSSQEQPRLESVMFDRGTPADTPFEQHAIVDRECFESFGTRAANQLQPLISQPLLQRYWPLAVARSRQTNNLGNCLTQARHQLEGQWGLQSLEIPQSRVCDLPAMRWFIAHVLAHLPRFWETYNSALGEFRRRHKIRSAAHPVPELTAIDDWLEAPLWIWSAEQPQRRRLFVRQRNDELVLTDRDKIEVTLSITPEGDAATAVEQLAALSARGIRIRTRALITTLAARLLLGDLFIHGIGGAKYDELTDRIIAQFFGVEPPAYMVVSGTLHLPIASSGKPTDNSSQLRRCVRELEFHPERFLDGNPSECGGMQATIDPTTAAVIAEKRKWIATPQTTANARQRCQAIRAANQALQPAVASLRQSWTKQAAQTEKQRRALAILTSRDYAFTLFPEMTLTNFLLPLLEISEQSG